MLVTLWPVALLVFAGLQLLDAFLTVGIVIIGKGREVHPGFAWVIDKAGTVGLIVTKVAVMVTVLLMASHYGPTPVTIVSIAVLVAFYGWMMSRMWGTWRRQVRKRSKRG